MDNFFVLLAYILGLAIILVLYRVLRGPTVFDRLIGLGVIGTKTILMLLLLGFLSRRVDLFVDLAIAYAALGFIGMLILAKYFEGKGEFRE